MIRINNVRLELDYSDDTLLSAACSELRLDKSSVKSVSLFRRSIDARKKHDVHFLATLNVIINGDEKRVLSRSQSKKAAIAKPYRYEIPKHNKLSQRPVIIGFGPAGIFAGLIHAEAGENPIIIE